MLRVILRMCPQVGEDAKFPRSTDHQKKFYLINIKFISSK
jgi:hypothetical protein